jgi:hypothetical protein
MRRRPLLVVPLAAATLLLAGCSNHDEPVELPSTTPSATISSDAPTPTITSEGPTESSPPPSTPAPTPTATATARAATVPDDWQPTSPSAAGVVVSDVDEVVGAWRLPNDAVASVVKYGNDVGSTDPAKVFKAYFGEGGGYTKETLATNAGVPVLAVHFTPEVGDGGDAQTYYFVLTPNQITSAVITGTPGTIDKAAAALWEFVRSDV